jgi:GR25 family glycosyltransferase involved in LPS biosynthesis
MNILLISVGNLQEYIIQNIYNLLLFKNNHIFIITERIFFEPLNEKIIVLLQQFPEANIRLIDSAELNDYQFNKNSHLNKEFRNGFWHLASLRLFYLYSFMERYNMTKCIHLENDVITYQSFDELEPLFTENKVYATFDSNRVIPGIIYIPNSSAFKPIIVNYDYESNDMVNLSKFGEDIVLPLPICSYHSEYDKFTKLFSTFHCIFDAAAMGQYLGGVDPRNIYGNTIGFVNEECVIKYDKYSFHWIRQKGLYRPHVLIQNNYIPIINLHIHSKGLDRFLADGPTETTLIHKNQGLNYFDQLYYINLRRRTDRYEHITNELKKTNLDENKIQRIDAIELENGRLGCSKSHIHVLEQFLETPDHIQTCIVLEDDFYITETQETINECIKNIGSIDFDVLLLSGKVLQYEIMENNSFIVRVIESQTTSGYCVHKKYARRLLENYKEGANQLETTGSLGYCIDVHMKQLQPRDKWYALNPLIGKQVESYSDIEKLYVNHGC